MLFTCGRVGNIRGVFIHGLPVWFRQVFSFQNLFLAMRLRVVDFFFLVNHALDDRSRDHEIFLLLMGSTSQSRSEQQDQPGFVQGGDPTGMTQRGGSKARMWPWDHPAPCTAPSSLWNAALGPAVPPSMQSESSGCLPNTLQLAALDVSPH